MQEQFVYVIGDYEDDGPFFVTLSECKAIEYFKPKKQQNKENRCPIYYFQKFILDNDKVYFDLDLDENDQIVVV